MPSQISEHEVRIFEAVQSSEGWLTSREAGVKAGVASRTARHHTGRLADLGVFDQARVFGGFRYRLKPKPDAEAAAYVREIAAAKQILGG